MTANAGRFGDVKRLAATSFKRASQAFVLTGRPAKLASPALPALSDSTARLAGGQSCGTTGGGPEVLAISLGLAFTTAGSDWTLAVVLGSVSPPPPAPRRVSKTKAERGDSSQASE